MRRTFSPYFDRMVRRALSSGDLTLLKQGRRIELAVMGFVQFPDRIQHAWDDERYEELAYLAEYVRAGLPQDLRQTDPVLYRHLRRGLVKIRKMRWMEDPRHRPGPLRIRAAAKRRRSNTRGCK